MQQTRLWARIEDGAVAELLTLEGEVAGLFHPALRWVEATGQAVGVGWRLSPGGFAAPEPPADPAPAAPPAEDIAALRAQLASLSARLAAL